MDIVGLNCQIRNILFLGVYIAISAESLSIFNSLYCELRHTYIDLLKMKKGDMEFKVNFPLMHLKGGGGRETGLRGGMWVLVI